MPNVYDDSSMPDPTQSPVSPEQVPQQEGSSWWDSLSFGSAPQPQQGVFLAAPDANYIIQSVAQVYAAEGAKGAAYAYYKKYADVPAFKEYADIGRDIGLAKNAEDSRRIEFKNDGREENRRRYEESRVTLAETIRRGEERYQKAEQRKNDSTLIKNVEWSLKQGQYEGGQQQLLDGLTQQKEAGLISDAAYATAKGMIDTTFKVREGQDTKARDMLKAYQDQDYDKGMKLYAEMSLEAAKDPRVRALLQAVGAHQKAYDAKQERDAREAQKQAQAEMVRREKNELAGRVAAAKASGNRRQELEYKVAYKQATPKEQTELLNIQAAERVLTPYGNAVQEPRIQEYARQMARTGMTDIPQGQPVQPGMAALGEVSRAIASLSGQPTGASAGAGRALAGELGVSAGTALGAPRSPESLQLMAAQRLGLAPVPSGMEGIPRQGFYRETPWRAGASTVGRNPNYNPGGSLQSQQRGGGGGGGGGYDQPRLPRPEPVDLSGFRAYTPDLQVARPVFPELSAQFYDPLRAQLPQTGQILGSFNQAKAPTLP